MVQVLLGSIVVELPTALVTKIVWQEGGGGGGCPDQISNAKTPAMASAAATATTSRTIRRRSMGAAVCGGFF
jgi:hypothetical protein